MRLEELDDLCDSIDAGVFSSDMLHDPALRNLLQEYINRWQRELNNTAPDDEG